MVSTTKLLSALQQDFSGAGAAFSSGMRELIQGAKKEGLMTIGHGLGLGLRSMYRAMEIAQPFFIGAAVLWMLWRSRQDVQLRQITQAQELVTKGVAEGVTSVQQALITLDKNLNDKVQILKQENQTELQQLVTKEVTDGMTSVQQALITLEQNLNGKVQILKQENQTELQQWLQSVKDSDAERLSKMQALVELCTKSLEALQKVKVDEVGAAVIKLQKEAALAATEVKGEITNIDLILQGMATTVKEIATRAKEVETRAKEFADKLTKEQAEAANKNIESTKIHEQSLKSQREGAVQAMVTLMNEIHKLLDQLNTAGTSADQKAVLEAMKQEMITVQAVAIQAIKEQSECIRQSLGQLDFEALAQAQGQAFKKQVEDQKQALAAAEQQVKASQESMRILENEKTDLNAQLKRLEAAQQLLEAQNKEFEESKIALEKANEEVQQLRLLNGEITARFQALTPYQQDVKCVAAALNGEQFVNQVVVQTPEMQAIVVLVQEAAKVKKAEERKQQRAQTDAMLQRHASQRGKK